MQFLPALFFLTSLLLRLATPHPWPQPNEAPGLTSPFAPVTYAAVRTFTYDSCEMQPNSLVFNSVQPDRCWDATPNPVFNMARGFGSFKVNYRGDIKSGQECVIVVYDNRDCRDGEGQGKSRVVRIGADNKMECFNVELGEGVKGFGIEWKCGKIPEI